MGKKRVVESRFDGMADERMKVGSVFKIWYQNSTVHL